MTETLMDNEEGFKITSTYACICPYLTRAITKLGKRASISWNILTYSMEQSHS